MGMLALNRLMSMQRDRKQCRQQIRARYGSIAAVGKRKNLPCQQDGHGDSISSKRMRFSIPSLPEEIWHHIHSLLPLRDAARAACLSHTFLQSWRCHPILTLNMHILGSNANASQESFSCRIDNILRNHSGIGINILVLELYGIFDACHYLDSWLQIAVTPGIEKFTLRLCHTHNMKYNVPCTLLSDGVRNSIQCLQLSLCAFHPTAELGPLRKLTSLCLRSVRISGDELEYFLSNSPVLKQLDLSECQEIMCLKIPCVLQQLHFLKVSYCSKLRLIESKARNLFSFIFIGERVKVSLGETMQMKNLCMNRADFVCYARMELPSNMPNLETLSIGSHREVGQENMDQVSIFGDSSQLRQIPEQHHDHLKNVKIIGFSSAKGLVELACYILKNAKSLDCLTLDTTYGDAKCDTEMSWGRCAPMNNVFLMEARRGAAAIRTYIEDKVPSRVKLTVVEHCRRCHAYTLSE